MEQKDLLDPFEEVDKYNRQFGLFSLSASVGMAISVPFLMDPMCLVFAVIFLIIGIALLTGGE